MNDILKAELEKHFKLIEEREDYIEKELEKSSFNDYDYREKVEKKLHSIAIKLLKAKNFQFNAFDTSEGTRFNGGSLAKVSGDKLEVREYKHRYWQTVDFLGYYNYGILEPLPDGFKVALDEIKEKIKVFGNLTDDYDKEVKVDIPISYLNGNKFPKVKISKIELSSYINIRARDQQDKEDNYDYSIDNQRMTYHNDTLFYTIKTMLDRRKTALQIRSNKLEKECNKIMDYIDDNFDMILVKTRLLGMN